MKMLLTFVGIVGFELFIWELPRFLAKRFSKPLGILICIAASAMIVLAMLFATGKYHFQDLFMYNPMFFLVVLFVFFLLTSGSIIVFLMVRQSIESRKS